MKKTLLFFLSTFIIFGLSAQNEDNYEEESSYDDITPKHSFTFELGLPVTTSNKPFQSMIQGLLNVAPYYQFSLKNHLTFGLGVNYSYFKANEFKTPEKVVGGIHNAGAFVKIGYEKFHSMRFGTDAGIKLGYASTIFSTDKNRAKDGPVVIDGVYIEPNFALVLTASEFTSYRFVVGYTFQGYNFNTSQLGINSKGGYSDADFRKGTQFMTFGFGFTYYFKQY